MSKLPLFLIALVFPQFLNGKAPYIAYEKAFCCEPASPQYNPGLAERRDLFESLYEAYHLRFLDEEDYLIPPLIHFVWLGSPLPSHMLNMITTWEERHPGWIFHIWTDQDVEPFGLQNKLAFEQSSNFGQKSDIFRYEILYRFGGLYVDTDFECLKSFDTLHKSCEFYTGVCEYNNDLYNGLIGTKPRHPILKACIDNLSVAKKPKTNFDPLDIMGETGPYYFRKMFLAVAPSCEPGSVVAFPAAIFYPVPGIAKERINQKDTREQFIKPESMCIHYWNASWTYHHEEP